MKTLLSLLSLIFIATFPTKSHSETGCIDAQVMSAKLITDICWDCLFPMKIAGMTLGGDSDGAPTESVSNPLCYCNDDLGVPRPGLVTSYWEPARLIEFQRMPGCSSVFNGMRFPVDKLNMGYHSSSEKEGNQARFLHYHYYAFPLLSILDLFSNASCGLDGYMDLDMMYMSELDPTWNDDTISFFTSPEAAFVTDPLMTASCAIDAAGVSTLGQPISKMFWCAGTWGSIYPLSGNTYGLASNVRDTSLYTVRVLAALHRRGITHRTMGEDAMCAAKIEPTLPKKMYKFTLLHPLPETKRSHWIGESEYKWGLGKTVPAVGEDLIYTIWRWNDCCMIKGSN